MRVGLKLTRALIVSLVILLASCGKGTPSQTTEAVNVYAIEAESPEPQIANRPIPKPIFSLPMDTPLEVLWDTYGKDYWACYIRTSDGRRGWVLCTSLDYKGDKDVT
jgi:hypothetical protein